MKKNCMCSKIFIFILDFMLGSAPIYISQEYTS